MGSEQRGVLVTGGTGALGRSVVKEFLDRGDRVHVSWVLEEELRSLEAYLGKELSRVQLHEADLTDEGEVARVFQEIREAGGLAVSAHIAGGFVYAPLEDTEAVTWRRMMEMNATTCFLCCKAAAELMGPSGGSLINVAAVPALGQGAANMSAYSASKAAVLNFTQSLAAELVERRITVNAIVPTMIDTPANREAMPDADRSTWVLPEEIARVVAFLASSDARIVTGSALRLSKG